MKLQAGRPIKNVFIRSSLDYFQSQRLCNATKTNNFTIFATVVALLTHHTPPGQSCNSKT